LVLVVAAPAAFLATRWALDTTSVPVGAPVPEHVAASAPTVSPQDVDQIRRQAERESQNDLLKPRFTGPLGDFVVVLPGQARQLAPFQAVTSREGNFASSEL